MAETKRAGQAVLPGDRAFQLHDTFGFPIDLTLEMAAEAGLQVDQDRFRTLMDEQRTRAKADAAKHKVGHGDAAIYRTVLDTHGGTEFLGYTELASEATHRRAAGRRRAGARGPDAASRWRWCWTARRSTPRPAASRPTTASCAARRSPSGSTTCSRRWPGLRVHRGTVTAGEVSLDAAVVAEVDAVRRSAIARAHTGTHLVHAGVRNALGPSAAQAGSLNAPGRLRFDFTSPTGAVRAGCPDRDRGRDQLGAAGEPRGHLVRDRRWTRPARLGAMMLFGEKYGDRVRVVDMGDYSRELCGGTHVDRTGEIGMVKVLSEASIGSGVRRVEALVGLDAFRHLSAEHVLVSTLAEQLKSRPEDLPDRVGQLVERLRTAERDLEKVRADAVLASAGALAAEAEDVGGTALVAVPAPAGVTGGDLRALAADVRGRLGSRARGGRAVLHRRRQGGVRGGHHRGRSGPRAGRRRADRRRSRPRSAAVAAANPTWPRAGAATRPGCRRRSTGCAPRCVPEAGEPDPGVSSGRGVRDRAPAETGRRTPVIGSSGPVRPAGWRWR